MNGFSSAHRGRFVGLAAGLLLLGACSGLLTQSGWTRVVATPKDFGLAFESLELMTDDSVRIHALWLPALSPEPRAIVVLAHGIGGNATSMLLRAAFLHAAGYAGLVVDLRGHGQSQRARITPGMMEAHDVRAAVAWGHIKNPSARVVLFGYSYGAVAAIHAATQGGIAAVVADAPFATHRAMMRRMLRGALGDSAVGWGPKIMLHIALIPGVIPATEGIYRLATGITMSPDKADALAVVGSVTVPILLIAREVDQTATLSDVRALYDSTRAQWKRMVTLPGATHDTYGTTPELYPRVVLAFLDSVLNCAELPNRCR